MKASVDVHFDLSQATAACAAGGIVCAELKFIDGSFYIAFETQAGSLAELVKANGRERRLFRDANAALKVVRELGISHGRFWLGDWDASAPKLPAWSRPDKAMQMRDRHRRAIESMKGEAASRQSGDHVVGGLEMGGGESASPSDQKRVRRRRGAD